MTTNSSTNVKPVSAVGMDLTDGFRIAGEPTYERFRQYAKILRRSPLRFSQKRSLFRSMLRHLFNYDQWFGNWFNPPTGKWS